MIVTQNKPLVQLGPGLYTPENKDGGKAKNLHHLLINSFKAPPTYLIPSGIFEAFLGTADLAVITRELAHVSWDEPVFESTLETLKETLLSIEFPVEWEKQIQELLSEFLVLIVRSSACFEDGAELSMAGQLRSFVVSTVEDTLEAVKQCWASFFEPSCFLYLQRLGKYQEKQITPQMGVVVQPWIEPKVSGVSFTHQGDGKSVLSEAIFGHGELLVAGIVSPDRYLVEPSGPQVECTITEKVAASMLVNCSDGEIRPADRIAVPYGIIKAKGTVVDVNQSNRVACVELPPEIANQPTLTTSEVVSVSQVAQQLQELLGHPIDMEWVIDFSGQFWVVQARRQTATLPLVGREQGNIFPRNSEPVISSPGKIQGRAYVARTAEEANQIKKGDILITVTTTPDYTGGLLKAGGVIAEEGGLLTHTSIVCRELGIPCLVGVEDATKTYRTGDHLLLDAFNGKSELIHELDEDNTNSPQEVESIELLAKKWEVNLTSFQPCYLKYEEILTQTGTGFVLKVFLFSENNTESPAFYYKIGSKKLYEPGQAESMGKECGFYDFSDSLPSTRVGIALVGFKTYLWVSK